MEKYFVADSYKDMEILGEPFKNEKGRLYVKVKGAYSRCGGSGHYSYNQMNGTRCGGSGIATKKVRVYTEKEYNSLQRAKERATEKKMEAIAAVEKDKIDNAAKYKHEVALKLGFGEDEKAYLVYGDDTFVIKDELKRMGARFNPTLKWYFSSKIELPEGYNLCEFSFDELYDYNVQGKWADFKENAKDIVSRRLAELKGPSTSVYYPGEIKERIRNITAKVTNIKGFEGMYGYTNVYTFNSGDYVFIWMTSKSDLNLERGDLVDLTGTIKKFDEYMGIRNTYLTRCIVKKVGE